MTGDDRSFWVKPIMIVGQVCTRMDKTTQSNAPVVNKDTSDAHKTRNDFLLSKSYEINLLFHAGGFLA